MSLSKIAIAAAHGITSRTLATWYPALLRSPRVLVPVHLQVLMVRQAGNAKWADCGMKVPAQDPGVTIDASTMMPAPFAELQKARDPGAYLHWALPDALTAGAVDSTTATFPAIPDRWLVMRLCPSTKVKARRTVAGWVLQAGDPNPQPVDLDKWTESGVPPQVKKPLTAMGHGDGAWAAYYDNVLYRFAFYDALKDVPQGPIAYVVCGWYADSSLDPLGDPDIHSLADFDAKLQQFQWSLPDDEFHEAAAKSISASVAKTKLGLATQLSASAQARALLPFDTQPFVKTEPGSTPAGPPYVTDGAWWPQGTLYHGSVVGIGWPNIGWPDNPKGIGSEEEGGPPSADKIAVAIGNTMGEALAALVSKATGSPREARILEAFQQGMLPELDEPDGRARLDARLQSSAFASISGGQAPDRVWQPASGPAPMPPANPATPAPGVFERYQNLPVKAVAKQVNAPVQGVVNGPVNARVFQAKSFAQETTINAGRMGSIFAQLEPGLLTEPYVPGQWVDTTRSLPRLFRPMDPVVLLQGVSRSFVHGSDGRFAPDGSLQCRLTGTCLHEYAKLDGDIVLPAIKPADVLDRGVENGSVPPECDEILGETAMLDPGSSAPIVDSVANSIPQFNPTVRARAISYVIAEQKAVHSLRDPRVDHSVFIARSGFSGRIPSPVSIGLPTNPWSPVHLDWQIEFTPSPAPLQDWHLGETDFNESSPAIPAPGQSKPLVLSGRCPLNAGATQAAAQAVRKAIDQIQAAADAAELPAQKYVEQFASNLSMLLMGSIGQLQVPNTPAGDRAALEDIATALENMDTLSAGFNTFLLQLRAGFKADGQSAPNPGDPLPSPFFPLRAGFLRVLRLRLVDTFGQFVDLAGSSASQPADPKKLLLSEPLQLPSRPELLGMPPRLTAPARLWFRFMDAAGSPNEARLATDKLPGISPVCGYVMPNHLDAALEFFGVDGANLGVVRPADDGSIIWEDAPGQPSTVGQTPSRAIPNAFLGEMGDALIRWGVADAGAANEKDNALQALLRVIDSTLWSVDPFGHTGDEHLSLLVGHPVAVMRATLRLELLEPVDPAGAKLIEIPVRLGCLAHWQDGLLGYFINDDYTTLYCSDAAQAGLARAVGPGQGFLQQINLVQGYYDGFANDAAADPVSHPFINTSGVMWIHPGQEVSLTMLVEPLTVVHATSGVLPRKEIGMRREWVTDALSKIAPTFRFGPVLVDPRHVRMPIAAELNGTWSWDHRQDVITWVNDPVTHATQDALLSPDPPAGSEGWLRLSPPDKGANP